jgi:hypothetical protein
MIDEAKTFQYKKLILTSHNKLRTTWNIVELETEIKWDRGNIITEHQG